MMNSLDAILLSNHGAIHRERGTIPGCISAPHDKTLLELNNLCEESTSDLFVIAAKQFQDGKLSWDRFMSDTKVMNRNDWTGVAMRRDIRARKSVIRWE